MTTASAARAPRGQGHLLREAILDAAVRRMAAGDEPQDISVREIAAEVGKTVPALYQHFPTKTDLLVAAASRALDDMATKVGQELASTVDLDTRLRRRAHAFVDFAVQHPVPYRLLFMTPPVATPTHDSLTVMMSSVGFRALVQELSEARTSGQMADRDPTEVAIILWTALHGVASLLIAHPHLDWPDDLLEQVLNQHVLGLAPRT